VAQIGQTTPSGGREWSVHTYMSALRRIVLPTGATLNHIGVWVREQVAGNTHDLVGAIMTNAGVLVYQTNVVTTPVANTSFVGTAQQMAFAGGLFVPAGTYLLGVAASGVAGDCIIVQGQNDSAGLPTFANDPEESVAFYPTWTSSDISAFIATDATRQWDIYLDYTEASAGRPVLISQLQTHGESFL
jgi:hypothetical protein